MYKTFSFGRYKTFWLVFCTNPKKSMKNITNIEQLPIEKYRCRLRAWSSSVLICIALHCFAVFAAGFLLSRSGNSVLGQTAEINARSEFGATVPGKADFANLE